MRAPGATPERELDDTLSRVLAAAQIGTWSYDQRPHWDATTKRLFGVAPEQEPPPDLPLSIVHPDDRKRYAQAFAQAVDPSGTGHFECDFRVVRPDDGAERWLAARGQSEFVDGRFVRLIGVVQDITERKRAQAGARDLREAEARLRERELELAQFVEDAPVAIAMFDNEMRYVAVSRRFSADYGTRLPAELIGRTHYDVIHDAPERWREINARVLAGEEMSAEEDMYQRAGGRVDWMRWSMRPWRDATGRIGGALLFSEIVTDEVEARHALAESEQRFRGLFEHAATGIALVGLDGGYQQSNPAFSSMVGYTKEELRGMNVRSLVHPEDLPALLERNDKLLAGEIPSFDVTNRYICKDGSVRWTRRFVSLLRDTEGRPASVMVLATDMTERIAYENRIGLLLREVNHRAKNMLGVVQAIARSTAATGADDFLARFAERIRALAAGHDLLVNSDWRGVELSDLVTSQLAHFSDLIGTRITVDGPPMHISGAAAQILGMAVHELATNAFKYGALSGTKGSVTIAWRQKGDTFAMDWIESGGPPAKEPEHSGFGTVVLDRMTRMALGGEVSINRGEQGLAWHLRCPLAKIAPTPLDLK